MKTFLITGATSGLGLEIARGLCRNPNHRVIITSRDFSRGQEVAASLGKNVTVKQLNITSLEAIHNFCKDWHEPLTGLVNNAGVLYEKENHYSEDGIEETLFINHLAPLALTLGLWRWLNKARVIFIGSSSQNPNNRMANLFGFRGERYTTIKALATGKLNPPIAINQHNRDRYATSKFLSMISAVEWAKRIPASRTLITVFDPGTMPGTGLVKEASAFDQFGWKYLLKWIGPLLPDTSTPQKSAAAAVWMLTEAPAEALHGQIYDYNRHPSSQLSPRLKDADLSKTILDQSLDYLKMNIP